MLLDAVISHPELDWLATATDKVAYFNSAAASDGSQWPQQAAVGTPRYFPDHLPIGVSPTGLPVFVFLATTSGTDDLKAFLRQHAALLQTLFPVSAVLSWGRPRKWPMEPLQTGLG